MGLAASRPSNSCRSSLAEVPPMEEPCLFALCLGATAAAAAAGPVVAGAAVTMSARGIPELVWSILRGRQPSKEQRMDSVGRLRQWATHARPAIQFQGCEAVQRCPSDQGRQAGWRQAGASPGERQSCGQRPSVRYTGTVASPGRTLPGLGDRSRASAGFGRGSGGVDRSRRRQGRAIGLGW